jgi:hypothetical protein
MTNRDRDKQVSDIVSLVEELVERKEEFIFACQIHALKSWVHCVHLLALVNRACAGLAERNGEKQRGNL